EGFVVYSFAGDAPIACREHVRSALGLGAWEQPPPSPRCLRSKAEPNDTTSCSAFALRIWKEAGDPTGSVVDQYLASRKLSLPADIPGEVIRFHPALKFDGGVVGGILSLFRDIKTNEPCGIHRTFLDGAGRKLGRKMLGRVRGAAIKLDADEAVELGLCVGEGV